MADQVNAPFSGIVLYRRDFKENDLLVKFITDRFGKKMFFLKGAKKRSFRLTAGILPFTKGDYIGNVNEQGLSFINAIQMADQFQAISADIVKNAYATYCLGLVDAAFVDDVPIPGWFEKSAQALTLIDEGIDPVVMSHIFEVQLLPAFGVAPNWQDCSVCHETNLPFDYSEQYGGLLCQRHWHLDEHRLHVTPKAIYLLRRFSIIKFDQINSIQVSTATKSELKRVLDRIYDDTVGLSMKSKKFIDNLADWEAKIPPLPSRKPDKND